MLRRILVAAALLLQVTGAIASPVSGVYGELLLAVDPTRRLITGYFESYTGSGQFGCIFYLRGDLTGQISKIKTWFPDEKDPKSVIEGVLEQTPVDGAPAVSVKLNAEHGGCWNVQHFAADVRPFSLRAYGDWKEIRVVSSRRAHFYDQPSEGAKRKAYVVRGNPLRLYEIQGGWARAEYVNKDGNRTMGWVREADLFGPLAPGD